MLGLVRSENTSVKEDNLKSEGNHVTFNLEKDQSESLLPNSRDDLGFTPLHYSTWLGKEEETLKLLKSDTSYINALSNNGISPIDFISYRTLKTFLDSCIELKILNKREKKVTIDYNFLMSSRDDGKLESEIGPLREISKRPQLRELIMHPVLASFLYHKWSNYKLIFSINLLVYFLFMVTLGFHIVISSQLTPDQKAESDFYKYSKFSFIATVFMLFLRECFQVIVSPCAYFKSVTNYLEMVLIVSSILFLYLTDGIYCKILKTLTIILATWEFAHLVTIWSFCSLSYHMIILKQVTKTFIKSLLLYMIIIVALALCFISLVEATEVLEDSDGYDDGLFMTLMRTFVMLTGEVNAVDENTPFARKDISFHIIFILSVFLITIVLSNLINALAINDTSKISETGEISELYAQIKVLSKYEEVFLNSSEGWNWKWCMRNVSIFATKFPDGKFEFIQSIGDDYEGSSSCFQDVNSTIIQRTMEKINQEEIKWEEETNES